MESKNEIVQLFQKLLHGTITAKEFHQLYTYVKRSRTDPKIGKALAEAWDHVQSAGKSDPNDSNEDGNGHLLRDKNYRLEDLIDKNNRLYNEIVEMVNKLIKGANN